MSSIKPTIGRKVWYWTQAVDKFNVEDRAQALDATVVFVNPDGKVNLLVLDHHGTNSTCFAVSLQDPADDQHFAENMGDDYATWMPYQVGQVKAAA